MTPSASPSTLRFIRQDVQGMHAYAVQDSQGMIKLDAMENPFTLPPDLQTKLGARLGAVAINRYPAQSVAHLQLALEQYVALPDGYSLMLGNGSDELISLLAMACLTAKDKPQNTILAPLPGFVMYEMSAQLQGLSFVGVPLTAHFELDEVAMLAAVARHKPAITYIAYPNNPTANLWDASVIQHIIAVCKSYGGLVVMDEAYQPFSSRTWLDEIRADSKANSHVLLMRTLSKFGLAGVRLGYMLGPADLIAQINKLRPPYNVSNLNAEAGLFALENQPVFDAQAYKIKTERTRLLAELAAMPGVTPFPSDANMALARFANADATFSTLKSAGILVKNVSKMHSLLVNCLRITVGTSDENTSLLKALQ